MDDRRVRSEGGKQAGEDRECPICSELVPKTEYPDHLLENHDE